jgi:hypothetical protein
MMTITIPIAKTRMYPFWTTRFEKLVGLMDAALGVVTAKKSTRPISARKIPF